MKFLQILSRIFQQLEANPRQKNPFVTKPEPWPPHRKTAIAGLEFYKLYFYMPRLTASAKHGRLMYLVNEQLCAVYLVLIYTHDDFDARPPDRDLKPLLERCRSEALLEIAEQPLNINIRGFGEYQVTAKIEPKK